MSSLFFLPIAKRRCPRPELFQHASRMVSSKPAMRPLLSARRHASMQASPSPSSAPDPTDQTDEENASSRKGSSWGPTFFKMFEAAATTFASISILGVIGYSYTTWYKYHILRKIEHAFEPGDPILELAAIGKDTPSARGGPVMHWIERDEQAKIDAIVNGTDQGRYYLLVGEKGTGKASMLIEAMHKINGEGASMFDCHADLEIFRIRLGKALDFEFHEDNIGSLFSIRGPRDASALLDIERAFNKLEKVALKRRADVGRPLILIINNMHLLRDDEDGRDLLELIQQRAEQWAAGNLCTIVFNSDDYWVYERLKLQGTRLEVMPVRDLNREKAFAALRMYRNDWFKETPEPRVLEEVYRLVGGRLAFLSKVAKCEDMLEGCREICLREKTWFLNQCWILGEPMDDDVMEEGKYSSAAMVLAKALVDQEKEATESGAATYTDEHGWILPSLPLHKARQVMTRSDYIQRYDTINVFTIDSAANVRADSVPMMHAFREVCALEGFDKYLGETLNRVDAIESLGRTREITLKDLWAGGKYQVGMLDAKGRLAGGATFAVAEKKGDDGDEKS